MSAYYGLKDSNKKTTPMKKQPKVKTQSVEEEKPKPIGGGGGGGAPKPPIEPTPTFPEGE